MLPLTLQSPREVSRALAQRVKALRLKRAWTQAELAERAGMTLSTYRRFERTGGISLERLVKLAVVLDALEEFDDLFARPQPRSIAELERLVEGDARKRGKRRDAKT